MIEELDVMPVITRILVPAVSRVPAPETFCVQTMKDQASVGGTARFVVPDVMSRTSLPMVEDVELPRATRVEPRERRVTVDLLPLKGVRYEDVV